MDPLSIAGSTASTLVVAARIIKSLKDVHSMYKEAPLTLSTICSECSVVYASLALIQSSLPANLELSRSTQVYSACDTALLGCALTLSVLDKEIQSCVEAKQNPHNASAVKKCRVVFEKDHLQELLSQVRGQQVALNLLLTMLQT